MYRRFFSSSIIAVAAPWLLAYELLQTKSWLYRRWLITVFFTVFGSTMLLSTGDGFRHQQAVEIYYVGMSFEQFFDDLWRVLTFRHTESGAKDVYKHLVSYTLGGILGMPQLFFPVIATVYGYFFAGSIATVLRNFKLSEANYVITSFLLIFLFVRGLEGFYTVRTWTGMWVLVYSCLKYYETRRVRYLILMFVPPFIHFGYFVLAIPAWIVLVFGSRPKIYAAIFLASSVTTLLPVEEATNLLSTTERGASQVNAYIVEEQQTSLEEFELIQEETNWYNAYRRAGLQRWAPTVFVFTLLFSGVYLKRMNAFQERVFSVGILTLAFSNATWFLFAVHNRSLTIAIVFLLAGFLIARLDPATRSRFSDLPSYYKWGLYISILLFIPLVLFHVSMTLDRMSIFIFGFPFVVWLDPELNLSIKQLLNLMLGRG